MDREGAIDALRRAQRLGPTVESLLDLALALQLAGDVGGEVAVCEQAVELDPGSPQAWTRLAHALARTDRIGECIAACERALELGADGEVLELLTSMRARQPVELPSSNGARRA
jgi:tetratricopeptide (TPR) repeat protein